MVESDIEIYTHTNKDKYKNLKSDIEIYTHTKKNIRKSQKGKWS